MNEQDKQLLLNDLCARLPYGVIVNYKEGEYDFHKWKIETLCAPVYSESGLLIETNIDGWIGYTEYNGCGISSASRALHLDKNLPYLRPISSMTEEEQKEFVQFHCVGLCPIVITEMLTLNNESKMFDWLNKKMFDYRGLIPMGLVLPAPERMYEILPSSI